MMTTESLIFLVYSRPELWDQRNKCYSSKDGKAKAWDFISEKMNISASQAKLRWTNLRDLFRRELKKTVKMAKMTGDPESYVPRWQHFKSMLFLKDQMIKDDEVDLSCLTFDDSIAKHYPETILEDEDSMSEMQCYVEFPQAPANNGNISPAEYKKHLDSASNEGRFSHDQVNRFSKRRRVEELKYEIDSEDYSSFASYRNNDTDEDYHFVMSILPSIRRISQDRKTSFKMKILQLIVEEEKHTQS